MHDKIIIFARFTNTQKVRKSAVFKRCTTLSQMNVARRCIRDRYKDECNLGSLDDPVLTGISDEDSEEAGDGVVVEGSDWEAFGDEVEMASRAEPKW